jgi:hypothetical protein
MTDFFDIFGGPFGPSRPSASPKKQPEKGIPWRAKVIGGDYYVPLRQVAELLAQNNVLPAVRKGIEARIQNERKN